MKAKTPEEGVASLAEACTALSKEIGLGTSFAEMGISEADWMAKVDEIAVLAFEDQCSPANPRVPLVEDMKEILKAAYKGE